MSAISVQGYMMKRKGAEAPAAGTAGGKSSRNIFKRSMSLKWVTRYFILYDDGRLVYHKERPAHLSGSNNGSNTVDSVGGGTLFATSVQQCDIERVNPDDLFGKDVNKLNVANSFHITVPRTQTEGAIGQTLLVTNGPSEYKSWIMAFRKASANVLVTDKDAALAKERAAATKAREEQEAAVKRAKEQAEKERLEAERLEKETLEAEKRAEEERIAAEAAAAEAAVQAELKRVEDEKRAEADRLAELQRVADEEEAKLKAEAMQLKKEAEEEEAKLAREMKEAEEAYQRSLSKDENGGEEVEVKVIEEGAVAAAAAAVGEESAPKDDDGKQESAEAEGETVVEVEGGTPKPQDSTEPQGGNTVENKLDKDETNGASENAAKEPESINGENGQLQSKDKVEVVFDPEEQPPAVVEGGENDSKEGKENEGGKKEEEPEDKRNCYQKALDNQVVVDSLYDEFMKMTEEELAIATKVYAMGNSLEDLQTSLDPTKVLFGIYVTSLEEMMPTSKSTGFATAANPLVAFSLEYEGSEAHYTAVNKYKDHLHMVGNFCKKHANTCFTKIHPLVYTSVEDTRGEVLKRLGAPDDGNEEEDGSAKKEGGGSKRNSELTEGSDGFVDDSIYSDKDKTAYKRSVEELGADNVPTGDEILSQMREAMGFPYNWVLFEPSRKQLIVKDAGSGGVTEITKLLEGGSYSDCVLFGLMRVSFSGDFGRRQFWIGIEWKGENCSSVKAMRQMRECLDPMSKMIGDRSFTLSNVAASEMTPDMFVERVTRSMNVKDFKVTVATMRTAHVEEQKAIKEYWAKLKEEKKAKERQANATVLAQEEAKKNTEKEKKRLQQVKVDMKRKSRQKKWSKMGAVDILGDIGNDGLAGWVLLEF